MEYRVEEGRGDGETAGRRGVTDLWFAGGRSPHESEEASHSPF